MRAQRKIRTLADPETKMLGKIARRFLVLAKDYPTPQDAIAEAEAVLSQAGLWSGTLTKPDLDFAATNLIVENDQMREAIDRRSLNPQAAESVAELMRMVTLPDEHLA